MNPGPAAPRGVRADAETADALVLVKYCACLHATRQVRSLAERAEREGKRLVIVVPKGFRKAPSLSVFLGNHPELVQIEAR